MTKLGVYATKKAQESSLAAANQTTVFVLCGGKGKRLRSLSAQIPKALVQVNGRPILAYTLEHFLKSGFRKFVFGTGHLSDQIENFAKDFKSPHHAFEFVVSNAGDNASMLQRICSAQNHFSEQVLICYGDTFIDMNYVELLSEHVKSNVDATIVTAQIQNPFGIVGITGDGFVDTFVEKPTYDHYIGSFVFKKSSLVTATSEMQQKVDGQGLVEFFLNTAKKKQLRAFKHKGLSVTFNTTKELEDAEKVLSDYYTLLEESNGTEK